MVACKRVETIRYDGHCLTVVETKDHVIFVGGMFVGTCTGGRVQIAPALPPSAQHVLEHYAHARGWDVGEGNPASTPH